MSSDDDLIIKYKALIKALIPYQQKGKLLEGLNRFSARLPARARDVIKSEVLRLTSQTSETADNSEFAQFPVKKFVHFGINMKLDKVGAEILKKETARYLGEYTVGVLESITNSEHYQGLIQRKQRQKVIEAFTVQAQSYEDIDFGEDLAVKPNFSVSSLEYMKGRSLSVSSISRSALIIDTARPPNLKGGDTVTFTIPEAAGVFAENTILPCLLKAVSFNADSQRFESEFIFDQPKDEVVKAIVRYLQSVSLRQPLSRNLELERTMQALDRDRILENSPWVPIFVDKTNKGFEPQMAMLTSYNSQYNPSAISSNLLPGKEAIVYIFKELEKYGEVFVLRGEVKRKSGECIHLCATARMLDQSGMMSQFIAMTQGSLHIQQWRLRQLDKMEVKSAMILQDIDSQQYPELDELSHVLFCRTLDADWLKMAAPSPSSIKSFPRSMLDSRRPWPLNFIMHEDIDRRSEPRYRIEKEGSVKLGLVSSHAAMVRDFSVKGMRLQLTEPLAMLQQTSVKVSVPELKLRGEKYEVVDFNPATQVLRLKVPESDKAHKSTDKIMGNNSGFFKLRDLAARQRRSYRFMWELASRAHPNVAVQLISGRTLVNRLKTVYVPYSTTDLYPFIQANNEVQLHGFLGDIDSVPPDSKRLHQFIHQGERQALAVHCIRKKDNRIIAVEQDDFCYTRIRAQMADGLKDASLEGCMNMIECTPCAKKTTVMTKQRLAQISKIDIAVYEKLLNLQNVYTHVLHLIDTTALHHTFLRAGVFPAKPDNKKKPAPAAPAQSE